jgi:hypothetical protein
VMVGNRDNSNSASKSYTGGRPSEKLGCGLSDSLRRGLRTDTGECRRQGTHAMAAGRRRGARNLTASGAHQLSEDDGGVVAALELEL